MTAIPKEYLDTTWDFGFTATDDISSTNLPPIPPQPTVNADDINRPILDRIHNLEINVGEVLNILERLEQAGTPTLDTDEYKTLITKDIKDKLLQVEALIMPLLVNLMKDSDTADYIHWPNRVQVLQKQIDKILAITRS